MFIRAASLATVVSSLIYGGQLYADIYKCIHEGRTIYSEEACTSGKSEEIHIEKTSWYVNKLSEQTVSKKKSVEFRKINIALPSTVRIRSKDTTSGWAWDIFEIKFFSGKTCQAGKISKEKILNIDDSHSVVDDDPKFYRYAIDSAFDGDQNTLWGGRRENGKMDKDFWVSATITGDHSTLKGEVGCISVIQNEKSHAAKSIFLDIYNEKEGRWINLAIQPAIY